MIMYGFIIGLILLAIFFYLAFIQQKRINKIKSNVDNINRLLSTKVYKYI
jgi:tetrahydromethanopterin S-methyltransferase subunit G